MDSLGIGFGGAINGIKGFDGGINGGVDLWWYRVWWRF